MSGSDESAWRADAPALTRLAYQMVGDFHEAEDLVQDCFERALKSPPKDTQRSWSPWLRKVLVHLAIDRLRQRQRRPYVGPWLPGMIDTKHAIAGDLAQRLQQSQEISFALLHALEQLTPKQRAVYVLRQLMELSGREVAELLEISEVDVRSSLARARKRLLREPPKFDRELYETHESLLLRLSNLVRSGDLEAVVELLSGDAKCHTDAGGQHIAALKTVLGAERVAKFLIGASRQSPTPSMYLVRECNGLPVLELHYPCQDSRLPPRLLISIDLSAGPSPRVQQVFTLSATEKLPAELSTQDT